MKYHILFLLKIRIDDAKFPVCCSGDCRLGGWRREAGLSPPVKYFLLTVPWRYFFCGSFTLFMSCLVHVLASVHCCLEVTCWERADLALVCAVLLCFVTCPCGILGQVWYLIVSIPDLCCLSYFKSSNKDVFHYHCLLFILHLFGPFVALLRLVLV